MLKTEKSSPKTEKRDHFEIICGESSSGGDKCYFLRLEGFGVLLDCGLAKTQRAYQRIKDLAGEIDVVVLSHCQMRHLSGLKFLVEDCGCKAQIFATLPTIKMGLMCLYDYFHNLNQLTNEMDLPKELLSITNVFNSIRELKYTESFMIDSKRGDEQVLVLQPFNAGCTLGGAVWKITNEIDTIVYCVDFNVKTSYYLNGLDLKILELNPTVLIIDTQNVQVKVDSRVEEERIEKIVTQTMKDEGTVLIPTDSSGRALEIICKLDRFWRENGWSSSKKCNLFFLTNIASKTVKLHASQQIQFMSAMVIKMFNEKRENPFHLESCQLIESLDKIDFGKPSVVICSDDSLDVGYSRKVFVRIASKQKNRVLFLEKPKTGTLSSRLIKSLKDNAVPSSIKLTITKKEHLEGKELESFLTEKKFEKDQELKKKREEEQKKKIVQIKEDDEEDDIYDNDPRLFLPVNMRYKSPYLMFPPQQDEKIESDDYGDFIDVEELKAISLKLLTDNSDNFLNAMVDEGEKQEKEKEPEIEIPYTISKKNIALPIRCILEFVVFDGRANCSSIQNVVRKIAPRQLILVAGDEKDKFTIKNYCTKHGICKNIFFPKLFEKINILSESFVFKVTLRKDLIDFLTLKDYNEFQIQYFEGMYMPKENKDDDKMVDDDVTTDEQPTIGKRETNKGHDPLFIGNVKLNKFRTVLNRNGITTQFKIGGGIICNDSIFVTKDEKSKKVLISGPLSVDYVKIRSILYNHFNII